MGKMGNPPPNCRKVKVRLFVFFTEEDRLFIFSIFKVRTFISTKCQSPPPQNQMVVPQLRTQNGSTSLGEKNDEQETRAMLTAGQCRQGCGRIQCDIQESTATSRACK